MNSSFSYFPSSVGTFGLKPVWKPDNTTNVCSVLRKHSLLSQRVMCNSMIVYDQTNSLLTAPFLWFPAGSKWEEHNYIEKWVRVWRDHNNHFNTCVLNGRDHCRQTGCYCSPLISAEGRKRDGTLNFRGKFAWFPVRRDTSNRFRLDTCRPSERSKTSLTSNR